MYSSIAVSAAFLHKPTRPPVHLRKPDHMLDSSQISLLHELGACAGLHLMPLLAMPSSQIFLCPELDACAGLHLMPLLAFPEARPLAVADETADLAATANQASMPHLQSAATGSSAPLR